MISFPVYGTPAPQGSKRHLGRGILVESSKKVKPWREAVKWAAIEANKDRLSMLGPVSVHLTFLFQKPKSTKGAHPITRSSGDIDKLCRSTLDALVDAGVINDDSQVVQLDAAKAFKGDASHGAWIVVSEV